MPRAGLARVARIARIAALGLGATIVFAVLAASVVLQGPRLGRLIEGALPPNAGKMHIGGVTWHLRALVDLVTDAPSPIAVEGLQIVDPEGAVVLDVPYLEAKVKLRTLINKENGAVLGKDEAGNLHIVTKYDVIQALGS